MRFPIVKFQTEYGTIIWFFFSEDYPGFYSKWAPYALSASAGLGTLNAPKIPAFASMLQTTDCRGAIAAAWLCGRRPEIDEES